MNTHTSKRPLNLITGVKPKKDFIQKILDEEVFECIKSRIEFNSTAPQKTEWRHVKKTAKREARKQAFEALVAKFGADVLASLKTNRKRKEFQHLHVLSAQDSALLRWQQGLRKLERRKERAATRPAKRVNYEKYIRSNEWLRRRNKYWQMHPRACSVCGSARHINLHHMSYRLIGKEPDDHLIALCGSHHAEYHQLHGTQRDMIRTTLQFVDDDRAKLIKV